MIHAPIPAFWCNGTRDDQARAYAALFPGATIDGKSTADWSPGGVVTRLNLRGSPLDLIEGGPVYSPTPALSLFVQCESEGEMRTLWAGLADGGAELMPLDAWPWATLFGWLQDRWGMTWQLNLGAMDEVDQAVTPFLTFVGDAAGRAQAAMDLYTRAIPGTETVEAHLHDGSMGDPAGWVMHARMRVAGGGLMLSENGMAHPWGFTPGGSLMLRADTQVEIDTLWTLLTENGGSPSHCGWLVDPFGMSWRIIPSNLDKLLAAGGKPAIDALMGMKRIDIAALRAAAG